MGWILLEVFVALLVAFGIVVWTAGARRKPDDSARRPPSDGKGQ